MRDKLLGTFVLPGGLAFIFFVLPDIQGATLCNTVRGATTCTSHGNTSLPQSIAIIVALLVAPFITFVHLERVRRRR